MDMHFQWSSGPDAKTTLAQIAVDKIYIFFR